MLLGQHCALYCLQAPLVRLPICDLHTVKGLLGLR